MRYAAGAKALVFSVRGAPNPFGSWRKVPERHLAADLGSDSRRYSRGPRPGEPVDGPGLHARENVIQPAQVLSFIMRIVTITLARS